MPQQEATVPVDSLVTVACEGRNVSTIEIDTRRPRFSGPMAIWRRAARTIGLHNTETQEVVVRRFLSLEEGRPCTEFRRAESERLLRAQPFLATASVRTLDDGAGGVLVKVETIDEVPALVAARYRGGDWALGLGNDNIFGSGTRVIVRAEQRAFYRDGIGAAVEHRQVFGRPYVLTLDGMRHPRGERYVAELGHAFRTDLQRFAWHTGYSHRKDYMRLRSDDGDATLTLPLRQVTWDAGGIVRIGPPGRTFLGGGVLTGERVLPAPATVLVTDTGFAPAPAADADAGDQYAAARSVRANAVGGLRVIRYRSARGVDALTGQQDLANGVQLGLVVGRSIPRVSRDNDAFIGAHLFAGMGSERSYGAFQLDGEARRAFDGPRDWDAILGSGRAAWYFKPARVFTSIASVEWAGGWRARFPAMLELGDREGGVRGFGDADMAGARRGVVRLEERWIAGPVRGRGDLGFAVFGDAGKVWAGDAPFGVTTPVAASVGLSVLAAVPVGGQRLYRADVAFPVRGPGRGVEVRFSANDPTRAFWTTPDDIMRARAAAIPQRVFAWP
ncbi:MAG: hypothetical protein H0X64_03335 [Gemmatimonadaceae bacterium]|nr:hypothetical protein [Gemmatimonadaceae bacterium]